MDHQDEIEFQRGAAEQLLLSGQLQKALELSDRRGAVWERMSAQRLKSRRCSRWGGYAS